jgi:hypothetical protein
MAGQYLIPINIILLCTSDACLQVQLEQRNLMKQAKVLKPRDPQEMGQEQEPQEQEQEDQLEQERVCFLRHCPYSTPPPFRKNTQILLLMQAASIHHQSAIKSQHCGALRPGVKPGRTQIERSIFHLWVFFECYIVQ